MRNLTGPGCVKEAFLGRIEGVMDRGRPWEPCLMSLGAKAAHLFSSPLFVPGSGLAEVIRGVNVRRIYGR
jgi:hypothetical protein